MMLARPCRRRVPVLVLFLTGSLCAAAPRVDASAAPEAPAVRVFGSLRAMVHDGQTGHQVSLSALADTPHLFGLGARADLDGEILILDGDIFLATPGGGTEKVSRTTDAGAALLVVTEVASWQAVVLTDSIAWEELEPAIEQHLRAAGWPTGQRMPFQIVGAFPRLAWHVVDGGRLQGGGTGHADHLRAADRLSARDVEARLFGLYSENDQGVFTHAGSRTHMHCLLEDPLRMGHVDAVVVPAGATLLLPRRDDPQATALVERMQAFLGPVEARQAVHSLTTEADCTGPGGSFRTLVRSIRPDRVYFEQESDRGTSRVWSLPQRTWGLDQNGDAAPLPAVVRDFVRGHEFHLHLLEFPQRFAGYRLRGAEAVRGVRATRIDMRDETGRPASIWIDAQEGRPVRLEVHPDGAQGAVRISYHVWKPHDGLQWFRSFELTEGDDRVFQYRYTTITTDDIPETVFEAPGTSQPDSREEQSRP